MLFIVSAWVYSQILEYFFFVPLDRVGCFRVTSGILESFVWQGSHPRLKLDTELPDNYGTTASVFL